MFELLKTFVAVAEHASFAKAAKHLNLSTPSVTRHIQELEGVYQAKLFARTTRHVGLTETGQEVLQFALDVLNMQQGLNDKIQSVQERAFGSIKIGLPTSILQLFVYDNLHKLLKQYPDLNVEIAVGNHLTHLLSEQFNVVVHCGPIPDSSFYYEQLASWKKILCASPKYWKKHGKPTKPDDLMHHNCLDHADNHTHYWEFYQKNNATPIAIRGSVRVDSSIALAKLAMQGIGVVYLPSFTVQPYLNQGSLVSVLDEYMPPSLPVYAIYSQKRRCNKKIDVVLEALAELFGSDIGGQPGGDLLDIHELPGR